MASRTLTRRAGTRRYGWITAGAALVILAVWESFGRQINPLFASYPSAIAESAVGMVADGSLLPAFWSSLQPLALGYLLSAVVGIPLGLVIGRFRTVEAALGVYVVASYAMPLVALVPLFVLWFGLGFQVKVAIVFALAVFPIVINTWAGVQAVPRTLVEVCTAFAGSEGAVLRKIIIPATVPHVMTGLRLSIGRAIVGIVVAEFFTAASGLGGLIIQAGNRFDTAEMFVPVVLLMGLGILLTTLVARLERAIAPWHRSVAGRDR